MLLTRFMAPRPFKNVHDLQHLENCDESTIYVGGD